MWRAATRALPETFKGGDPRDPQVDSLAKQVANATGRPINSSGYDLLAVGQPNAGNDYPVVTVTFQSGLSGTSPSMQEIVDSILNQFKATYAVPTR